MERTTVYYHIAETENGPLMAVTAKAYWDANHFLDDGGSDDYVRVRDAMQACRMVEDATSVYMLPDPSFEQTVVTAMAARGFDMVRDPAFGAWLDGKT